MCLKFPLYVVGRLDEVLVLVADILPIIPLLINIEGPYEIFRPRRSLQPRNFRTFLLLGRLRFQYLQVTLYFVGRAFIRRAVRLGALFILLAGVRLRLLELDLDANEPLDVVVKFLVLFIKENSKVCIHTLRLVFIERLEKLLEALVFKSLGIEILILPSCFLHLGLCRFVVLEF